MALIVLVMLIGAAFFFVWRRSELPGRRLVANIGGIAAVPFALLAAFGLIRYFQTLTP